MTMGMMIVRDQQGIGKPLQNGRPGTFTRLDEIVNQIMTSILMHTQLLSLL